MNADTPDSPNRFVLRANLHRIEQFGRACFSLPRRAEVARRARVGNYLGSNNKVTSMTLSPCFCAAEVNFLN
jgi:hypothetical protein